MHVTIYFVQCLSEGKTQEYYLTSYHKSAKN